MSNSLPGIHIIGFANKAVDEAKDRIRSAFAASNVQLPRKRITINLAPADVPKTTTSFDLGIAIAIMQAAGMLQFYEGLNVFSGELGLDGSVRPVRGIIGILLEAKKRGANKIYIPESNRDQASLISGISIIPVASFFALCQHILGVDTIAEIVPKSWQKYRANIKRSQNEFAKIRGQNRAKRALCIAAAGRHNIMLHGPPGTGKSMLAKALISVLPPLTLSEMLTASHIHSLSNREFSELILERPFRAPHHSASSIAIVGGGVQPRPGEISLAHGGVLFLDELPEFKRATIESLRQPLEDKFVRIVRTKETIRYPSDFMLVTTANPCPCGQYGSDKPCVCTSQQIVLYQKKMSGPIMDRIDLFVRVDAIKPSEMLAETANATSLVDSDQIAQTLAIQHARYGDAKTNNTLQAADISTHAQLSTAAATLLETASMRLHLSNRSYIRCIRVARTIADLAQSETIESAHMAEALQYRSTMTMP